MSRVEALRAVIRVAYVQRDFAVADGACSSLDLFEQTTADTTPSVTRQHQRMTLRSSASAATARPASSGLSEFDRSKTPAASTASVRTRPGYRDTTATQCGSKSCAHSAVSRSVAALATP